MRPSQKLLTEHQKTLIRKRIMEARQVDWLREVYGITPYEFEHSPASVQEAIRAAWSRYWRDACPRVIGRLTESDTEGDISP